MLCPAARDKERQLITDRDETPRPTYRRGPAAGVRYRPVPGRLRVTEGIVDRSEVVHRGDEHDSALGLVVNLGQPGGESSEGTPHGS